MTPATLKILKSPHYDSTCDHLSGDEIVNILANKELNKDTSNGNVIDYELIASCVSMMEPKAAQEFIKKITGGKTDSKTDGKTDGKTNGKTNGTFDENPLDVNLLEFLKKSSVQSKAFLELLKKDKKFNLKIFSEIQKKVLPRVLEEERESCIYPGVSAIVLTHEQKEADRRRLNKFVEDATPYLKLLNLEIFTKESLASILKTSRFSVNSLKPKKRGTDDIMNEIVKVYEKKVTEAESK